MQSVQKATVILITGKPGIGKTTLFSRVFNKLCKHDISVFGFKTEEVRDYQSNRYLRLGFDIVLFSEQDKPDNRAQLARLTTSFSGTEVNTYPRVGQYSVNLASFENLAIPCLESILGLIENPVHYAHMLSKSGSLVVCMFDEIGKMELFSAKFSQLMGKLANYILNQYKTGIQQLVRPDSGEPLNIILLATVPISKKSDGTRGLPLVDSLCSCKEIPIIELNYNNRDGLVDTIYDMVLKYTTVCM